MSTENRVPDLERTQRQLTEMQRLARLGSWEFDVRANHVTWTDGLYEIYGLDRSSFPATYEGYLERLHPGDRERVQATIGAALEQGGSFEFEERIIRPDGEIRTLLSVGRVLGDESGAPLQLLGVCRDVTLERRAQQELERREQQLATAQAIAHVGSWDFDVASSSIIWSDELYHIYGLVPGEPLTYDRYRACLHQGDAHIVEGNVQRALETGEPFTHEHRVIRPDGSIRTLLGRGEVQKDEDGRVVRMIGTAQDITDRLRAEEQAHELVRVQAAREEAELAARRLEFISQASATLASSLDYEETLRNVARLAVPEIADWCAVDIVTQEQEVVRLAFEHTDPSKVKRVLEIMRRYPAPGDADFGLPRVLRTGNPEWAARITEEMIDATAMDEEHARLLRDLDLHSYAIIPLVVGETVIGALTFGHAESKREFVEGDLLLLTNVGRRAATAIHNARLVRELSDAHGHLQSQAQELEAQAAELEEAMAELETRNQELEEKTAEAESARAEAERANAAKSQFLANMSHELRTPLNAIGGYAELLELGVHGPVTDAQRTSIERIKTNQARLIALINDLLNFVKLRAGRLEITLQPVMLNEVINSLAPMVEPQVQKRGLVLSLVSLPEETFVLANRERLEQVLLNLLSNAVTFTQPGGAITVDAETLGHTVLVHVTDTGCGISAEQVEHIFEPFMQITQLQVRDNQGVGLGLAISRDLMQGMGGTLNVVSEPGAGSRFTLTLARATREAAVTDQDQIEVSF